MAARISMAFPDDFTPFIPGLEMKYALEEAEKNNTHVHFAGMAITDSTIQSLRAETRMNFLSLIYRFNWKTRQIRHWRSEWVDEMAMLSNHGGEGYSEIVDDFRANWWVGMFEKAAPLQKNIMVDNIDKGFFRTLYEDLPGKNIVAVVNQWHCAGIESHWRHSTNTEILREKINPIGDFDINQLQEGTLSNEMQARHYAKIRGSEPMGSYDYILHYHLVAQEYERHRHLVFDSYADPHLEHGLFNDENKDVESLPYDFNKH